MGTFKINDKTAKTALVDADLYALGDSEDLSGSDFSLKKTALSDLLTYMQNGLSFAGVTTIYLDNTDSPYTVLDTGGQLLFVCDTSGGDIDITLPTLADNQDRVLEFIHQTSGNNLNIDGEGAETIDGLTDIDLPKQGDRLKISGTTSEWAIRDERISCQLRLQEFAAYGGTDTQIPQYTNALDNYGNIFTENHSTGYNGGAEGIEITINKTGKYSFSFASDDGATAVLIGLSLNSAQLTTSIQNINVQDRINGFVRCDSGSNLQQMGSWAGFLNKNDIIRVHTNGVVPTATDRCYFTATYVGN